MQGSEADGSFLPSWLYNGGDGPPPVRPSVLASDRGDLEPETGQTMAVSLLGMPLLVAGPKRANPAFINAARTAAWPFVPISRQHSVGA